MEPLRCLSNALDAINERILIIDTEGRIIYCNQSYKELLLEELGKDVFPLEGKLLSDLRPGARLPETLVTKAPILRLPRQEKDNTYFMNAYPIFEDDKISGAVSVGMHLQEAFYLKDAINRYLNLNKQAYSRINNASVATYTFDSIVAESPLSIQTKELAERLSKTDATILLESETGTGKELYAQSIHNASNRKKAMFVPVNCANFNSELLDSELFGYEEGAFTGAKKGGKIGLFEAAYGGTIFLDEISEMDISLQAKLLRAIQENRIRQVGSIKETDIDVRIIAASNVNLSQYVKEGKFRKDLYYRINAFRIKIPPLRDRTEDIPKLIESMLTDISKKLKKNVTICQEAVDMLIQHQWPGNVRELQNILQFSTFICEDNEIRTVDLPDSIIRTNVNKDHKSLKQMVNDFERDRIMRTLKGFEDNLEGKIKAAELLGISLSTLYKKISDIT